MTDFVECETCKAKPGAPSLCPGCRANRGTIARLINECRSLKATIDVHLGTIRDQDRQIGDSSASAELAIAVANQQEEIEEQASMIREQDWTIEEYRTRFAIMAEKREELTPECDDSPYDEPRRPEDMGAGRGLEVTPRTWGRRGS